DGTLNSATATVSLTVNGNTPPVARNDAFTINEDTALTTGNLLSNNGSGADTDPDAGQTLTVNTTPVSGPSNGTLVLNANGTFSYTPNSNFFGTDSFVYRLSDGAGGTATATVTITVNNVNDAPVA